MKKALISSIIIFIIIMTITGIQYYSYKAKRTAANSFNSQYEQYLNKEIFGIDVASLINKSVDKNINNKIEKDSNNFFIQNDTDSIIIDIYMKDTDQTYRMETIYNSGTEQFVQYCGDVRFKNTKTEYHKSTGKIKYILFEQIE